MNNNSNFTKENIAIVYNEIKEKNPNMSLDELFFSTYEFIDFKNISYSDFKIKLLSALNFNELEHYTKNVNSDLKQYIEKEIFPQYKSNDKGHQIEHIKEVIRRSFALNDTLKLKNEKNESLDSNLIYTIAAYHDLGKYEDHKTHHLIAAKRFIQDKNMLNFFNKEEIKTIENAIKNHRSSNENLSNDIYSQLISSADRNTCIEIVFRRSFGVAQERMPDSVVEDYLDYTIERLRKKYDEKNPENMPLTDKIYSVFLDEMRDLLKPGNEDAFKKKYCEVNNLTSRNKRVIDFPFDIKEKDNVEIEL